MYARLHSTTLQCLSVNFIFSLTVLLAWLTAVKMTNRCQGSRSLRNDIHISFAIIVTTPTEAPVIDKFTGNCLFSSRQVSDSWLYSAACVDQGCAVLLICRPCLWESLIPRWPLIGGFKNSESQMKLCNWATADHCWSPEGSAWLTESSAQGSNSTG